MISIPRTVVRFPSRLHIRAIFLTRQTPYLPLPLDNTNFTSSFISQIDIQENLSLPTKKWEGVLFGVCWISKVFFTPHHVSRCCTNVVRDHFRVFGHSCTYVTPDHCCVSVHSFNNVITVQRCATMGYNNDPIVTKNAVDKEMDGPIRFSSLTLLACLEFKYLYVNHDESKKKINFMPTV
jgi:hypothetical protein